MNELKEVKKTVAFETVNNQGIFHTIERTKPEDKIVYKKQRLKKKKIVV